MSTENGKEGAADATEELTLSSVLSGNEEGGEGGEGDGGGGEGDGGDGEDGKKPKPTALNISRFKEIDEEVDDEEKAVTKFKTLKEENAKLRIVAAGKGEIEKDKQIGAWKDWTRKTDDELFFAEHFNRLKDGGYDEAAAKTKAKEKLDKATPEDKEELAIEIRGGLNKAIREREATLLKQYEESSSKLDIRTVDTKVADNAVAHLSKTETFLGITISKDATERQKLAKEAAEVISSGELNKALKDPEFVAQVALLRKYGAQFAQAIASRTNGKSKILEKLPKAPASSGATKVVRPAGGGKKPNFNPKAFK